MFHKFLFSIAILSTVAGLTAPAFADVPVPECVDNPACHSGKGCSVGALPGGAPAGAGAFAVVGLGALLVARRRKA